MIGGNRKAVLFVSKKEGAYLYTLKKSYRAIFQPKGTVCYLWYVQRIPFGIYRYRGVPGAFHESVLSVL